MAPQRTTSGSFQGPSSGNLLDFYKSIQNIPSQHRASFQAVSNDTMGKICSTEVLHVWESDSDLDNLLHLTAVIAKLRFDATQAGGKPAAMVVITEEKAGRNNFERLCELVKHLTGNVGKKHFENTVCAFDAIVVVRGINNITPNGAKELAAVVKRINTSLERVLKMSKFSKLVWHHGPVIPFLLHWINATTPSLRKSLTAITVTGAIDFYSGVKPSPLGQSNRLAHVQRLEKFAKDLDVPVVFANSADNLINFDYLATYMYFFAYYVHTFVPASLARSHLFQAQDDILTFAFRLRGACDAKYGDKVVTMLKSNLNANKSQARRWAKTCINPAAYTRELCREAARDAYIHHAVQLADCPFALFCHGNCLPAFVRLAFGPIASPAGAPEYSIAVPSHISFTASKLRPAHPSPFHILVPTPGQTQEKATARIQGLMMGVLERVRSEKGMPTLDDEEKTMWKEVARAALWALEGCGGKSGGKMPKGQDEKLKFVREKLEKGSWSYVVGAKNENGVANGNAI